MSELQTAQAINSIAQVVSGAGLGVSIKRSEVTDVKLLTTINTATKDGERTKSITNTVEILSETVLVYDAGYEIRFSSSLESSLAPNSDKMIGDMEGIIDFIKTKEPSLWFDLYSTSLNLEPSENVSLVTQNQAVIDFISENDSYQDDDSIDGVIGITFEDYSADYWQGEVQTQLAGYSTGGDECKLPADLIVELKAQLVSQAIEFLS